MKLSIFGALVQSYIRCLLGFSLSHPISKHNLGSLISLLSVKDLIEQITSGELDLTNEPWSQISDRAKNLVRRCLDKNPETRILPIEALNHDWMIV